MNNTKISELHNYKKWCRRLYDYGRKRGIPVLEVKKEMKRLFNVDSSRDLTMDQYNQLREIVKTFPVVAKNNLLE